MAKKKVLYVITKSNWGGAQRYVFDLATALPKDRFDVAVAYGQPGLLAQRLAAAGIQTHLIAHMQRDISAGSDWKSFAALYKLLRAQRPDVVHLNSSKAGGLGALAARLAGIGRIVFTAHGWSFWEKHRGVAWRAFARLGSWATMLLSHKVVCISDYDLRVAQKMPFVRRKLVRIYNGIGPIEFGSGSAIRGAFPAGVKITGTVGELNANKNQRALIREARDNPNRYVAIVGDGELRSELEGLIQKYNLGDRVKLFGFIPAADVLKGFDVFALPSKKEGLPYVLLEAKAAGLPIEASPVGGIPEILRAKDMSEFTLERMVEKTSALY